MRVLKRPFSGDDVRQWQAFLAGHGYTYVDVNGRFDDETEQATKAFQILNALEVDGAVGPQTLAVAIKSGFPLVVPEKYPAKPDFPYPNSQRVREMFGVFRYEVLAKGAIRITDGWAARNIVKIKIPQLIGVEGAPPDGVIYVHRRAARQLQSLFAAWESAGLLKYVKSWGGSFVPRMVRGSRTQLSNHAFGSAFDINAAWNGLGQTPAGWNSTGTVLPLVKLANEHGFFWGGHYNSRLDGMHFELAVLDRFPAARFPDLRSDEIKINIEESPVRSAVNPAVFPSPQVAEPVSGDRPPDTPIVSEIPVGNSANSLSDATTDSKPETLNVEDYKPFVKRWLSRAWSLFTGGNLAQASGFGFAAIKDSENWQIYLIAAAVVFAITLLFAIAVSIALGVILWLNRKEISHYLTLKYQSLIDPTRGNIELSFEKK